jgi:hypothetical protein
MTQANAPIATKFEVGGFMCGFMASRYIFFCITRRTEKTVWGYQCKTEHVQANEYGDDGYEVPIAVRRSELTDIEQFRVLKNENGAEYIHRARWLYITPYDGKPKSFMPL